MAALSKLGVSFKAEMFTSSSEGSGMVETATPVPSARITEVHLGTH